MPSRIPALPEDRGPSLCKATIRPNQERSGPRTQTKTTSTKQALLSPRGVNKTCWYYLVSRPGL